MNDLIAAQKLIGEDAVEMMYARYRILNYLAVSAPAGRRAIAQALDMSERTVRNNLAYLAEKKLVSFTTAGVVALPASASLLEPLGNFFLRAFSFHETEEEICRLLNIESCSIVANIETEREDDYSALGFAAEKKLTEYLEASRSILVSGDEEVSAMCRVMKSTIRTHCSILPVCSARDGGELASANALALSRKLKCNCFQLRSADPDATLFEQTDAMEEVRAVTIQYAAADLLCFGVSTPTSAPRFSGSEHVDELWASGACAAEVLGYYLDSHGRVLSPASERGIALNDLRRIPHKLLLAGGAEKKNAIIALSALLGELHLITDYSCAAALLGI